jgi:hypothetical protein
MSMVTPMGRTRRVLSALLSALWLAAIMWLVATVSGFHGWSGPGAYRPAAQRICLHSRDWCFNLLYWERIEHDAAGHALLDQPTIRVAPMPSWVRDVRDEFLRVGRSDDVGSRFGGDVQHDPGGSD